MPLTLLYALLLALTLLALQDPVLVDKTRQIDAQLQLLSVLAMVVMAGLLVHQEPLVGTTAFWLTRPIHRGSLLKAKALFLFGFIVAPVAAASLGVAFAYGMELASLPTALWTSLTSLAALLIVAVLLAAVTPSTVIYLLTWIGILFVSHLVNVFVGLFVDAESHVVSSGSKDLAWAAALAILGGLLVTYQYLTRRTRRTLVGIGVACLASVAISETWRWELLEWKNPLFTETPVTVTLSPAAQNGAFNASRTSDNRMTIAATPRFLSLVPVTDFEIESIKGEWRLKDNSQVPVRATFTPAQMQGIEADLGEYRWLAGQQPAPAELELKTMGQTTFDELMSKSGTLEAEVYGQAYSHRLAGKIPLTVGQRFEKGPVVAVIRRINEGDSALHIVLRQRLIQSVFGRVRFPQVLLINDARKEMSLGTRQAGRSFQPSGIFMLGPLIISREETYAFPLGAQDGDALPGSSNDWLADADLAFMEWTSEGRYQTTLRLADFRTRDATFDPQTLSSSSGDLSGIIR